MIFRILLMCVIGIMLFSCASSIEQEVLQETNTMVQMMKIREQSFNGQYQFAEDLYTKVREQHRANITLVIEIDFEIAFLQVKQNRYERAKTMFESIITQYELSADVNQLPQWPYYLSKKILEDVVLPELDQAAF